MKFYRYEAKTYALLSQDEYGRESPNFSNPELELSILNLYRETDKGYWIGHSKLDSGFLYGDKDQKHQEKDMHIQLKRRH